MTKSISAAIVGLLALTLGCPVALAQSADDAFGLWLNPENGSNIELYKCGEGLCAKITKVTDGQTTDDKNPDPAKRSQPIVGLVIMENAKKSGAKWTGTIYNRDNGKSYSGTIAAKSKDAVDWLRCCRALPHRDLDADQVGPYGLRMPARQAPHSWQ